MDDSLCRKYSPPPAHCFVSITPAHLTQTGKLFCLPHLSLLQLGKLFHSHVYLVFLEPTSFLISNVLQSMVIPTLSGL